MAKKCLDCEHQVIDEVDRCGGRRESPCVCKKRLASIDHMNAHLHADGSIHYELPCSDKPQSAVEGK